MKYILSFILILILYSCEAFILLKGEVYDAKTKNALKDVSIILVLNGCDTVQAAMLEYDTLSFKNRTKMREQGIQDNYNYYDPNGLSKYVPAKTNNLGQFKIGNMLVGCVPKCPTCDLVFIKNGYEIKTYRTNTVYEDSIIIYLEKEN